jgi:hypothetical protein
MIMNQQLENPRTLNENLRKPGTALPASGNRQMVNTPIMQPVAMQSTFSKN